MKGISIISMVPLLALLLFGLFVACGSENRIATPTRNWTIPTLIPVPPPPGNTLVEKVSIADRKVEELSVLLADAMELLERISNLEVKADLEKRIESLRVELLDARSQAAEAAFDLKRAQEHQQVLDLFAAEPTDTR